MFNRCFLFILACCITLSSAAAPNYFKKGDLEFNKMQFVAMRQSGNELTFRYPVSHPQQIQTLISPPTNGSSFDITIKFLDKSGQAVPFDMGNTFINEGDNEASGYTVKSHTASVYNTEASDKVHVYQAGGQQQTKLIFPAEFDHINVPKAAAFLETTFFIGGAKPDPEGEYFSPYNIYRLLPAMMAAHNEVRAAHNLPELTWSNELANFASEHANYLQSRNCLMQHRDSRSLRSKNAGENLAWSFNLPQTPHGVVIDSWESEKAFYNLSNNRCQPGKVCGHYTQLVWRDTQEVGCAKQRCDASRQEIWVCNYRPAGNIIGQSPF